MDIIDQTILEKILMSLLKHKKLVFFILISRKIMEKGLFYNLLTKFHLIISERQFILFLDEIMQFDDACKNLAFLNDESFKKLEPFVMRNFDLEENSNLLKSLIIIVNCLAMPL